MQSSPARHELEVQLIALRIMFVSLLIVLLVLLYNRYSTGPERFGTQDTLFALDAATEQPE